VCRSKHVEQLKDFSLLWRCDPTRVMASSCLRFLDHTQRRNTVGGAPLDEWSARRRDLYLTTHNTHNRQTSMPRWDSNPRSQQASGHKPTPSTARPLGPAIKRHWNNKFYYTVASCWLFIYDFYYDARVHEHQEQVFFTWFCLPCYFILPVLHTYLFINYRRFISLVIESIVK